MFSMMPPGMMGQGMLPQPGMMSQGMPQAAPNVLAGGVAPNMQPPFSQLLQNGARGPVAGMPFSPMMPGAQPPQGLAQQLGGMGGAGGGLAGLLKLLGGGQSGITPQQMQQYLGMTAPVSGNTQMGMLTGGV